MNVLVIWAKTLKLKHKLQLSNSKYCFKVGGGENKHKLSSVKRVGWITHVWKIND